MGKKVYLDNAATTPIDPEVIQAMTEVMQSEFGNPSSTHFFGRSAKGKLEQSRRTIAGLINAQPREIIFTSGGTEADNMALISSVKDLGVKRIITSGIEHHAVLHTIQACADADGIQIKLVKINEKGFIDLNHLQTLLEQSESQTLVSLMHANNEIGNLLPLKETADLCKKHNALFHTDTVQTMGHYPFDMGQLKIDFLTCGAHKLHGPKGVGFLFKRKNLNINPLTHGGSQEAGKRAGTENLYGIVGMAKALEIAYEQLDHHTAQIQNLKAYMIEELQKNFPDVQFNGGSAEHNRSLYTILNAQLPRTTKSEMLLFHLDIMGIATSGGSACSSGSNTGSHVLNALPLGESRPNIRFSFSKYNSHDDIDYTIQCLKKLYKQ